MVKIILFSYSTKSGIPDFGLSESTTTKHLNVYLIKHKIAGFRLLVKVDFKQSFEIV